MPREQCRKVLKIIFDTFLDGNSSASAMGFSRDQFLGPQNTQFLKAIRNLKMALTKAQLLKHDFPVHGLFDDF